MSKSIDFELQRKFIFEYLNGLNCPRALSVWLLYTSGEHDQLVQLEFNPEYYNDKEKAQDSLAATKLLSKATFLKVSNDPRRVAIDKFVAAEAHCRVVNSRIRNASYVNPKTAEAIYIAQQKIISILGCFSPEQCDEFVDSCDWGPGASTKIPRRLSSKPNKYQIESGITREAYEFAAPWFKAAYPLWGDPVFDQTKGIARIVTVPKTAKTDRTIAIEPGFNLWFQKGIGTMIRRRLSRIGVDLNHQDHNQALSRLASMGNHLATVDFSSASDTISIALVEELFSPTLLHGWLNLMRAFRSSSATLDGVGLNLHKFSSMGNGFTFDLESLIFYAVSYACCILTAQSTKDLSIFGDDLILPSKTLDFATSVFEDLGFHINAQKSFSSGYYRESCGAHWWDGSNVKPIFLKEPLYEKLEILKVANSVRRLAHRRSTCGCDSRLRRSWLLLASSLGSKFPRVSEGFGDCGLVVNFSELTADQQPARPKFHLEGFLVKVLVAQPSSKYFDGRGLLLDRVRAIGSTSLDYAISEFFISKLAKKYSNDVGVEAQFSFSDSIESSNDITLPLQTKYRRKSILVPRWYDFGSWY